MSYVMTIVASLMQMARNRTSAVILSYLIINIVHNFDKTQCKVYLAIAEMLA